MSIRPAPGSLTAAYLRSDRQKWRLLALMVFMAAATAVYAITRGGYDVSWPDVFRALAGRAEGAQRVVITHIRLPRVVAAVICGWGLSLAGLCFQTLLKNPLAAPSTLGISQGAACGAAMCIVFLGAGAAPVTAFAFAGAMAATLVILLLDRIKRLSSGAIILAGVALSSLFTSATILIQYLATETELAMVVFWTFGDVARSDWKQIGLLAAAVFPVSIYLLALRWDFNVLACDAEAARGLGVRVEKIRIRGMVAATLVCALATAFHGVIAFVGLIAPHTARRLVGDDHRLLIPFSAVVGAWLLLLADTLGRQLIGSGTLPVGVITSFLGAPIFLFLLVREAR